MDYRDRLYAQYASGHTAHLYGEPSLAAIRRQFSVWRSYFGRWLPGADRKENARLLDLGCGNGDFVHWLQTEGYTQAEGIDRSREQIALGKKLGIAGLAEAGIEDFLPAHGGTYDFISARDVLEHFRKDEVLPLLDQVYAALRPGGVFVAQTVNAENLLWGRLRHGDFTHENVFTTTSMQQVLRAAGFKDIQIRAQRPVAHGLFSMIRLLGWFSIELRLRVYLLIETGSLRGVFTQNLLVRARK